MTSREKKIQKWGKHRGRLIDALESNVYNNQIDELKENLTLLRVDEFLSNKNKLLFIALRSGSEECSEYLIQREATANSQHVLNKCDFDKIDKVYKLLSDLSNKYDFIRDSFYGDKKKLITRLIDPHKVQANDKRINFLLKLLSDGFFDVNEVKSCIDYEYEGKPEKKAMFRSIYREITLNELGI
jgi:hypothetical protein